MRWTYPILFVFSACSMAEPGIVSSDIWLDLPRSEDGTGHDSKEELDVEDATESQDLTACDDGDRSCSDDSLRMCINGQWSVIEPPCSEGCQSGTCNLCRPAQKRCNGLDVEICDSDGQTWLYITTCGECGGCDSAECVDPCAGRECGDNGCGESCGTCDDGLVCTDLGKCCKPKCLGDECGDDGCGGVCGTCDDGMICHSGMCLHECTENRYECLDEHTLGICDENIGGMILSDCPNECDDEHGTCW